MLTRAYLLGGNNRLMLTPQAKSPGSANRRAYLSGWLLLILLTTLFLTWIFYRWLAQPIWLVGLPAIFLEFIDLVEMATAVTLTFLWLGLLWRQFRPTLRPRVQALDLEQLYELSPEAFEHYVAGLFRQKGYRVAVRGGTGDHGVDLELIGSGNRKAVVQCKRYRTTVGEEIVRDLFGTLFHEGALHGFLITTADISDAAREWAVGKPITLIDGPTLVAIAAALEPG